MAAVNVTSLNSMTPEQMFDSIGPAYEEAFAGLKPQLDSIQWVLAQIHDRRPAKVLDLGCGTGRPVCSAFADAGHDVLGVDVSGVMIKDAQKKVLNAKFIKDDVFKMNLSPDTYDAVTVYFSLAADTSQDLIRRQIHRIADWLKVGGVLVIAAVPYPSDKMLTNFLGRPFTGSGLSAEQYIACIRDAGLEIVRHSLSSFKPKGAENGICKDEEAVEEQHLFIYARKG